MTKKRKTKILPPPLLFHAISSNLCNNATQSVHLRFGNNSGSPPESRSPGRRNLPLEKRTVKPSHQLCNYIKAHYNKNCERFPPKYFLAFFAFFSQQRFSGPLDYSGKLSCSHVEAVGAHFGPLPSRSCRLPFLLFGQTFRC